jgi:glycosyltransferase involved in cell wall biosynthesis
VHSEQGCVLTGAAPTSHAASPLPMWQKERSYAHDHVAYPLITIGIPTRNRSSLLKRCLDAAFAQTYRNIEVLVSDNASTDNTLAVLDSIDDSRLRVLRNRQDIGASENFATCIREAKGDYIVLVSDDNFLDPTFLEKCAHLIRREPELPIVLAGFDYMVLGEFHRDEQRLVAGALTRKLSTGIWHGTEILSEYLTGRLAAGSLSVVVRTDLLRRNNRYSSGYRCAADIATWVPALLEGRAGLVNERCAVYLAHDSAISAGILADDRLREYCSAIEEISSAIDRKIADKAVRSDMRGFILQYLASQVMITLVLYRRAGASFVDVVRKLWDWRAILKRCTLRDFVAILRLRSVARILLPSTVARWSLALGLDKLV